MKVLLIDDNANKGWKQIIEKVFPVPDINVVVAINSKEAKKKIEDKFDLIFLDVRLSEQDHQVTEPTEFSGYKILQQIKRDFLNINFSTPIILMTATNKIWNIDAFRNYGVDGYYIKEHPDYIFDKKTSIQNYNNLKKRFIELKDVGHKRNEVWELSKDIFDKISNHTYFNENDIYKNVKLRIEDKLKLGYDYLFKEHNLLETKILKTNNEAIAFIIYFSILEEIMKGYSSSINWIPPKYSFSGNWKFRNNLYFIENLNESIKVNITKDHTTGFFLFANHTHTKDEIDKKYIRGEINLSEQIYSLFAAYSKDKKQFEDLSIEFQKINKFRNKIDFIHSEVSKIYEKPLIDKVTSAKQFEFCIEQLKFLNTILLLLS